jgi:hypothetical protein
LSSRLLYKNVKIKIYRTIIFPVVLYGRETWHLTLNEEHTCRLRVFENRVPWTILAPKRDEGKETGGNCIMRSFITYSSPSIIRMMTSRTMRWSGLAARMWEMRNVCRILVGKPEGKRPLGMPGRRREDDIKIDLREISCSGIEWIDLAKDSDQWRALVDTEINLRLP